MTANATLDILAIPQSIALDWEEGTDHNGNKIWTASDEYGWTYRVSVHYLGEGYEGEVVSKGADGQTIRRNSSSKQDQTRSYVRGVKHNTPVSVAPLMISPTLQRSRNVGKLYKTPGPAKKWCEKQALANAKLRVSLHNARVWQEQKIPTTHR